MNTDILYLKNTNDKNLNFIPKMNYDIPSFLKYIYDIDSWSKIYEFYNKNKFINKYTIDRILSYGWITFKKDYKLELSKIYKIYEIYFNNKKNIEIKNILRKIPEKNIHQFIISHK